MGGFLTIIITVLVLSLVFWLLGWVFYQKAKDIMERTLPVWHEFQEFMTLRALVAGNSTAHSNAMVTEKATDKKTFRSIHYAEYQFTAWNGKTYTGRAWLPEEQWAVLQLGNTVTVAYATQDPEKNYIKSVMTPRLKAVTFNMMVLPAIIIVLILLSFTPLGEWLAHLHQEQGNIFIL